ncbi:MAG: HAD family hydrolase [Thiomicrorhabdus sp.]|jgi:putative hydrolase of the HAD superfamily|nr:HAD family hydrolase [Thiomicrorhabdus sp.]
MVIIFDLDDTLYDERMYVESGLRAVAAFGADRFGWDPEASFLLMIDLLEGNGRGAIFDRWLAAHGQYGKGLVKECVRVYRHHTPSLQLCKEAEKLFSLISDYPLYLVTDGHKIVQQKKVNALGIEDYFNHVFITHHYGIRHAKPSIYCFRRIMEREGCDWNNMMYVGDNPEKDFVNLNTLGLHTIRVLTGVHRNVRAQDGYDAQHVITDLGCFPQVLQELIDEN